MPFAQRLLLALALSALGCHGARHPHEAANKAVEDTLQECEEASEAMPHDGQKDESEGAASALQGGAVEESEEQPWSLLSADESVDDSPPDHDAMMNKLKGILQRFKITIAEANDLVVLQDYEMVVIADDSGSMRTGSRWTELNETVTEIVEIASCFDESGVDVFFLNRRPILGVRHATEKRFKAAFANRPSGTTPLTKTLQTVTRKTAGERPVLLFILTDGVPDKGTRTFKRTLKNELATHKLRVQIMACTEDDNAVGWLNTLDVELEGVDVTDDYRSEEREVRNKRPKSRFTRGDWVMKAVLGPVSDKFDAWDE